MAKSKVHYEVNLASKSYLEQVRPVSRDTGCKNTFVVVRFGRPVTRFRASPGQARKIASGKGKLRITETMIRGYHSCVSGWGR
jgi:hypothetical protein